jgi:hypothetical protein
MYVFQSKVNGAPLTVEEASELLTNVNSRRALLYRYSNWMLDYVLEDLIPSSVQDSHWKIDYISPYAGHKVRYARNRFCTTYPAFSKDKKQMAVAMVSCVLRGKDISKLKVTWFVKKNPGILNKVLRPTFNFETMYRIHNYARKSGLVAELS